MDIEQFRILLMQPLYDAFGKDLNAAQVKQYYRCIKTENEQDLKKLVDEAMDSYSKFPSIKELKDLLAKINGAKKEKKNGSNFVLVTCCCGAVFSVLKEIISNGQGWAKCTNNNYTDPLTGKPKCTKTFLFSDLQKCKEDPPGSIIIKNQKVLE